MCDVQDRMLGARGMPEHIQRPHVDNMEALKAPVFFLWELLGYGTARELSEKGIKKASTHRQDLIHKYLSLYHLICVSHQILNLSNSSKPIPESRPYVNAE